MSDANYRAVIVHTVSRWDGHASHKRMSNWAARPAKGPGNAAHFENVHRHQWVMICWWLLQWCQQVKTVSLDNGAKEHNKPVEELHKEPIDVSSPIVAVKEMQLKEHKAGGEDFVDIRHMGKEMVLYQPGMQEEQEWADAHKAKVEAFCNDITFFLYFYFYSYYSALFCSIPLTPLHSQLPIPLFPQLPSCIVLFGSAVLRYMTAFHTQNITNIWHLLPLPKHIPASLYPRIPHCM